MKLVFILIAIYAAASTGQDSKDLSSLQNGNVTADDIQFLLFGSNNTKDYTSINGTNISVQNVNVTADDIQFFLFGSNNTKDYTLINASNISAVNKTATIYFIIHGWTQNHTAPWVKQFTKLFLELDIHNNVIQVDYSKFSQLSYVAASSTVKDVGYIIADLIVALVQNCSVLLDNVLVVGHSLGAHVASFTGKKVQKVLNQKLPSIIAPDPAGPLFEDRPESERLNKNDAKIVIVQHSNGGRLGYLNSCGTLDIFINGGSFQPGCRRGNVSDPSNYTDSLFCAHRVSWQVVASAIEHPHKLVAKKYCPWWQSLIAPSTCSKEFVYLEDFTSTKTGNYFINTTASAPFYKN